MEADGGMMDQETMMEELELLRKRLKRRNVLLDEVRAAYLRDVVAVKESMRKDGREIPGRCLTTLDLRPTLALYAPSECTFRVAHGGKLDEYGGIVEIVHSESKKVVELRKKVEELVELEQEMRIKATELEIAQQKDQLALVDQREQNRDERDILSKEIANLKERLSRVDEKQVAAERRELVALRKAMDETKVQLASLSPVVEELRSSKALCEKRQTLLRGKERRVKELEAALANAGEEAQEEVRRYNNLEAKFIAESKERKRVQKRYEDVTRERDDERARHKTTQDALNTSRKTEAELRQTMTDLKTEFNEARLADERDQEALREQADNLRSQTRASKADAEDMKTKLEQEKASKAAAINKARKDVEAQLEAQHAQVVRGLKEATLQLQAKIDHLETKKRHSLTMHQKGQEHVTNAAKGGPATLDAILDILDDDADTFNQYEKASMAEQLELIRSRALTLIAELDQVRREKTTLEGYLDKYRRGTTQSSTTIKLGAMLSTHGENATKPELIQAVKDAMGELSRLETELEISVAEKESAEAEIDELREALESQERDMNDLLRNDMPAKNDSNAAATLSSAREKAERHSRVVKTFKRAANREVEAASEVDQPRERRRKTDNARPRRRTMSFRGSDEKSSGFLSAAIVLADVLDEARGLSQAAPEPPSGDVASIEAFSNAHAFLTREHLASGGGASQDQIEALHRSGKMKQMLTLIRYRISSELAKARASLLEASANHSSTRDAETDETEMSKLATDDPHGDRAQPSDEPASQEIQQQLRPRPKSSRKSGDGDQIERLQDELATMKNLVYSAVELKRKCQELEARCRTLEHERAAIQDENDELSRDKSSLDEQCGEALSHVDALKALKDKLEADVKSAQSDASALRMQLAEAQSRYDETVLREKIRLETNKGVGVQVAPLGQDAAIQTTFKTPAMTLRRINSLSHVPHKRCGPSAVTPAVLDEDPRSPETPLFYHRPDTGVFHDRLLSSRPHSTEPRSHLLPMLA